MVSQKMVIQNKLLFCLPKLYAKNSKSFVILLLIAALLLSALAVAMIMSIDFSSVAKNLRLSSSRSEAQAKVSIYVEPNEYNQGVDNG